MDFMYNVFADNEVSGTFPTLNQRTRSYAVVILSSSNIHMNRNHLVNPASQYELATHLLELAVVLQATAQWWGTTDYNVIIERIFDQYRSVSWNYGHFVSCLRIMFRSLDVLPTKNCGRWRKQTNE